MNEKDAWEIFSSSGSVKDYLNFKEAQHKTKKENKNTEDEIHHQRTCNQTTEYR